MVFTLPLSFGTGESAGGSGHVELDYDDHNPLEEAQTHSGDPASETNPVHKEIDFDSFAEPIKYRTAIWLNNVGKIDKEAGVYELDFWYIIESDDVNFLEVGTPPIGFINSKTVKMDSEYTEEHYHEVRVRGIFFNVLDFSDYPFEKLDLTIEIEPDMPYHVENAIFTVDEDLFGVDEKVNVIGWELKEPSSKVLTHDYENWHSFSRYVIDIYL